MDNNNTVKKYTGLNRILQSDAIQTLKNKLHDGTCKDFFGDWKWIFSYSKKYKWIIVLYTFIGLFSSSLSLVASYIGKVLINIIVEKQYQNLWVLIVCMVSSTIFSSSLSTISLPS